MFTPNLIVRALIELTFYKMVRNIIIKKLIKES